MAAACTDCDWCDTYDTGTEARDAKLQHAHDTGHGGGGKFLLADRVLEKFDIGDDGRHIPDGSLYQHARAAWYAHKDDLVEDSAAFSKAEVHHRVVKEVGGNTPGVDLSDYRNEQTGNSDKTDPDAEAAEDDCDDSPDEQTDGPTWTPFGEEYLEL